MIGPPMPRTSGLALCSIDLSGALLIVAAALACTGSAPAAGASISVTQAHVVARYPHDARAFTQGLLYAAGALYESTGLYGQSSLRRVTLTDGGIEAQSRLPRRYFGEGLARVGARLIQLTWKSGVAFVYDLATLERVRTLHYHGEGWGLAWNGRQLIMSDGSDTLRFIAADTFRTQRRLQVTRSGQPVENINELEYINGEIWANVRYSDNIIRIDPGSGAVTGIVETGHLRRQLPASAGVLNGIAWDMDNKRLFITGKNWPALFQIHLPDAE